MKAALLFLLSVPFAAPASATVCEGVWKSKKVIANITVDNSSQELVVVSSILSVDGQDIAAMGNCHLNPSPKAPYLCTHQAAGARYNLYPYITGFNVTGAGLIVWQGDRPQRILLQCY